MSHESPNQARRAYRGDDVNFHILFYVVFGLVLLIGLGLIANRIFFDIFRAREAMRDAPASPFEEIRVMPPEPRLQVTPSADLEEMNIEMRRRLELYEWVDPETGTVRIPIERAMEVLVERGLPEPAPETPPGPGSPAP